VTGTDAELLDRCRGGDLSAFEDLYRAHAARLYGLACRLIGNRSEAEDLLQEIFLVAYRRLATFRGDSALGTWLYRLAVNRCVDHLRSRASRQTSVTAALLDGRDEALTQQPAQDWSATRIDLERAIRRLPDGYRTAFVLHDVEGLEHREIAEILGIAEGTSKSQVHKARLRLRALLEPTRTAEEYGERHLRRVRERDRGLR